MQEQNQRINYNSQIEKERGTREEKQQQQSERMLKRFDNSSAVPKSAEDRVVFEKFANEAKDAANENDAYQYARAKYEKFDTAREAIKREADVPGFATKMFRQAVGTYKSKENMLKDLQPYIKQFKDLGLEKQARAILTEEVGLGAEDTELAMYPPSKEESSMYNKFEPNPERKKVSYLYEDAYSRFPGEESALGKEGFIKFKDNIASFLEKNPEANLIAMRGVLNQDKQYSWTDISKAVSELVAEGRLQLDPIQEQQFTVVKSPPLPGLGALFKEIWKDTK